MKRKTVRPRFFVLLSLIAVAVFCAGTMAVRARMDQNAELLKQVRQEQQALVDELDRLEEEIEYAQTEEYIENAAREELKWLKPGEIRYMPQE